MGSTVSNAVRQHLPALPVPHLTNAKSSTYISCTSAASRKCEICNYLNIDHSGVTSSHKCEIFCYFKKYTSTVLPHLTKAKFSMSNTFPQSLPHLKDLKSLPTLTTTIPATSYKCKIFFDCNEIVLYFSSSPGQAYNFVPPVFSS